MVWVVRSRKLLVYLYIYFLLLVLWALLLTSPSHPPPTQLGIPAHLPQCWGTRDEFGLGAAVLQSKVEALGAKLKVVIRTLQRDGKEREREGRCKRLKKFLETNWGIVQVYQDPEFKDQPVWIQKSETFQPLKAILFHISGLISSCCATVVAAVTTLCNTHYNLGHKEPQVCFSSGFLTPKRFQETYII